MYPRNSCFPWNLWHQWNEIVLFEMKASLAVKLPYIKHRKFYMQHEKDAWSKQFIHRLLWWAPSGTVQSRDKQSPAFCLLWHSLECQLRHRRLISSMWGKSNISEFRHLWVKDGDANLYSSRSSTRGLPYDKLDLVVKILLAGQRLLKVPCQILPI